MNAEEQKRYTELKDNEDGVYMDTLEPKDQEIIKKHDAETYLPKINKMRADGKSDLRIAYYIYDLYQNCEIDDDAGLADAAGISDETWEAMLEDRDYDDVPDNWDEDLMRNSMR